MTRREDRRDAGFAFLILLCVVVVGLCSLAWFLP